MHAAELARGRWPDLLVQFGVDRKYLTGKHSPCPVCGGHNRFRFDNEEGRGTFFCSSCGAGDGFRLLELFNRWPFKKAAIEIERVAGMIAVKPSNQECLAKRRHELCERTWRQSTVVSSGDPGDSYLLRRTGLSVASTQLRYCRGLPYRHDDGRVSRHPAMVAKVSDSDGRGVAIHRTYLTASGDKADLPQVKKSLGSLPPASAIRLFPADREIGIAEGIETAISAALYFGVPVWAAISANGLKQWSPPAGIERVTIYGDNDLNGVGQSAAWNLAQRLIDSGIETKVEIPDLPGSDWNSALPFAKPSNQNQMFYRVTQRGFA